MRISDAALSNDTPETTDGQLLYHLAVRGSGRAGEGAEGSGGGENKLFDGS